jgi:hypothetical protein
MLSEHYWIYIPKIKKKWIAYTASNSEEVSWNLPCMEFYYRKSRRHLSLATSSLAVQPNSTQPSQKDSKVESNMSTGTCLGLIKLCVYWGLAWRFDNGGVLYLVHFLSVSWMGSGDYALHFVLLWLYMSESQWQVRDSENIRRD